MRSVKSSKFEAKSGPSLDHSPSINHKDLRSVDFSFLEGIESSTESSNSSTILPAIRKFMYKNEKSKLWNTSRVVIFLIVLGIIPAAFIFILDLSVHALSEAREELSTKQTGGILGLIVHVLSGLALCLLSTLYCHLWSTEAEGSGIPQMKSIMSGFYDRCKGSLSLWTMAAKTLGLICAISGGLPVGWEGPNVHISCIFAHHLSRIPYFRPLRNDKALRMQIMVCACSVGLASSFGTPIGGVLYALETTSSFYLVPTFWKSLLATISGAFFYDMLYKSPVVLAFDNTSFAPGDYTSSQIAAFALLGALSGVLGAFFVKCVYLMYELRKKKLANVSRYIIVGVVAIVAAGLQYPVRLFRLDPRRAINELFSADKLTTLSWVDVLLLVLIKFPLIAICIGLPIPAGVFIPCFLMGSCFGRLYGEALKAIFGISIVPGGYAVVGAAAFTAGVSRALSCAVIIFEVTGQLRHMLPTLVAVVIAVIVGNTINRPLYDTLIIMKGLPYMPHMRIDRNPDMLTKEVMSKDLITLQEHESKENLEKVLLAYPDFESFPVVEEKKQKFLGCIRRQTLEEIIENYEIVVIAQNVHSTDADHHAQSDITHPPQALLPPPASHDNDIPENVLVQLEPNISPLILTENANLGQVHFMFVMLMPTHAFVLARGVLVGVLRRKDIIRMSD